MELAMNGLVAVNALIALAGACVTGFIAARERIYNGEHDAARRR